jgi:hypothetical protein
MLSIAGDCCRVIVDVNAALLAAVLVGNKCDLSNRQVPTSTGAALAKAYVLRVLRSVPAPEMKMK